MAVSTLIVGRFVWWGSFEQGSESALEVDGSGSPRAEIGRLLLAP